MKRLQRVEHQVAATPLRRELIEAAFQKLRENGVLPDWPRLAAAVVERALATEPPKPNEQPVSLAVGIRRLDELVAQIESGDLPDSPQDEVRRHLLREAVAPCGITRSMARLALTSIAGAGKDVTMPLYLDECIGLPEHGTVGMHAIGLPHFVKPPHEDEARRLLEQAGELRATHRMPATHSGRHDATVGPPVPSTAVLLKQMTKLIELAAEIGVVDAGAVGSTKRE